VKASRSWERWASRAGFFGLVLWGAGVELNEGVAAVGLGLTAASALAVLASRPAELRALARRSWPVLAYVGWMCLGASLAGRWPTGTGVSRALEWCAVPLGVWALADRPAREWRILGGVVAGGFLVSCVAAGLQSFGWWPPLEAFAPLRFTKIPFQHVYEPVQGSPGRFMGGGLLFHRLKFAHVGALTVLFALPFALKGRGRVRWIAGATAGLGAVAVLLFPLTRAAAVALVAAAAGVAVVSSRRRLRAAAAGALLVVAMSAAAFSSQGLRGRFEASLSGEGSGHRLQLWESGLNAVRSAPVLGVGAGRFVPRLYAPEGASPEVLSLNAKAHNQLLTIAAEGGLVGLLLFLWMLISFVRRLWGEAPEAIGALGGLLFFALISMLHDPLFHPVVAMALMLAIAAGLASRGVPAAQEEPGEGAPSTRA
jgi:O-antigen ligase